MTRDAIINGFMAGEVSSSMYMRTELPGLKYAVKQATNFILTAQGPIYTKPGSLHFDRTSSSLTGSRIATLYGTDYQYVFWLKENGLLTDINVYGINVASGHWYSLGTISAGTRLEVDISKYTILHKPGSERLYFFHPEVTPWRIRFVSPSWIVDDINFTSAPTEWTTDPPAAACFFQGRLYVGGSGSNGHIFWASKTNSHKDFTIGSLPADAMEYELVDPVQISWMQGAKNLLIGTDTFEYVASAQDGVLIPGDIDVRKQSNFGSSLGQSIQVGNGVVYRSLNRRQLRSIQYEWTKEQWDSKNLLFASEHMTKDATIIDLTYNMVENLIYATLSTGVVLCGLFNELEQFTGWTPLEYSGAIESAQVVRQDTDEYSLVLASYDTVLDNRSIMYQLYVDLCNTDNSYFEDDPPASDRTAYPYHVLGTELTCLALSGYSNLVVTYKNVLTVLEELWDSDAANMVSGIYNWVAGTGATVINDSNSLKVTTTNPAVAAATLQVEDITDFTEDLEIGVSYELSFEAKDPGYTGAATVIYMWSEATSPPDWHEILFYLDSTSWKEFRGIYTPATQFDVDNVEILIGISDTSSLTYLRNFSLKKQESVVDQVIDYDQSVDGSDIFYTTRYCKTFYIGRPYTCTLETLPIVDAQRKDSYGTSKRWTKAYIKILDSYPLSINGRAVATYTEADQEIQAATLGHDHEATLTLVQDKSYTSVIAGIYGFLGETRA